MRQRPSEGKRIVVVHSRRRSRTQDGMASGRISLGQNRAASTSDPDLVGERRFFADEIQRSLEAQLPRFQDAVVATIKSTFEAGHFTTTDKDTREQARAETAAASAANGKAIQNLTLQLSTLQIERDNAQNEIDSLKQKNRVLDNKAKRLHALILDNSLGSSGLNDDQLRSKFNRLNHDIVQLVMKYCTRSNAKPKDTAYSDLPIDARPYLVASKISQSLYRSFFDPGKILFGFTQDDNNELERIYLAVLKVPHIAGELEEWRLKTCALGMACNSQLGNVSQEISAVVVENIWKKIHIFMPQITGSWLGERSPYREEVENALATICKTAYDLAMQFRTSKVEYKWVQGPGDVVEPSHAQILGTVSYKNMRESRGDYKIVFGGVIKGGGLNGNLKDEVVHITDSDVLLGPFAI